MRGCQTLESRLLNFIAHSITISVPQSARLVHITIHAGMSHKSYTLTELLEVVVCIFAPVIGIKPSFSEHQRNAPHIVIAALIRYLQVIAAPISPIHNGPQAPV
jgi:hypothetical protein